MSRLTRPMTAQSRGVQSRGAQLRAPRSAVVSQVRRAARTGLLEDVRKAAAEKNVPVDLLLAVGSRESRLGGALTGGTDESGKHHGIWQIHEDYHPAFVRRTNDRNDYANAKYAAGLLRQGKDEFGFWPPALAAYNAGGDDVRDLKRRGKDITNPNVLDQVTTRDYVQNVIQRRGFIKGMEEIKDTKENKNGGSLPEPDGSAISAGVATWGGLSLLTLGGSWAYWYYSR